ncbi:unnamed protein product [Meloidogyne enterolobii]|uniref:Uncharacterized protein n=1 Tax=Meloidogyne enterolobii TaxID=390850 RepID=A0ACB0ZFX2_MELEN
MKYPTHFAIESFIFYPTFIQSSLSEYFSLFFIKLSQNSLLFSKFSKQGFFTIISSSSLSNKCFRLYLFLNLFIYFYILFYNLFSPPLFQVTALSLFL